MLLEMQNAMNNMMNNSHGNQPLFVTNPTTPLFANGVSPDSSGSDSSSRSASNSPQRNPSDSSPESLISMDTSQSSDSSSATDSGEEEVIGTVTRAHQETFLYNQEQVNVPSEAPDNHSHFTEKQVWNRQVDASSMTNQNSLLSCITQVPEDSSQQNSTVCPVRSANTSPSGPALQKAPLRYHKDTHVSAPYSVPTCARANRMHLVS